MTRMSSAEAVAEAIEQIIAMPSPSDWLASGEQKIVDRAGSLVADDVLPRDRAAILQLARLEEPLLMLLRAAQIEHTDVMTEVERPYWEAAVGIARALIGASS